MLRLDQISNYAYLKDSSLQILLTVSVYTTTSLLLRMRDAYNLEYGSPKLV